MRFIRPRLAGRTLARVVSTADRMSTPNGSQRSHTGASHSAAATRSRNASSTTHTTRSTTRKGSTMAKTYSHAEILELALSRPATLTSWPPDHAGMVDIETRFGEPARALAAAREPLNVGDTVLIRAYHGAYQITRRSTRATRYTWPCTTCRRSTTDDPRDRLRARVRDSPRIPRTPARTDADL